MTGVSRQWYVRPCVSLIILIILITLNRLISNEEMAEVLDLTTEEVNELIGQADLNGDGSLSEHEFVRIFLKKDI